ncbi:Cytochrome P450 [Neofusicoccum parvum]|nr:Cytochrome P450 [Neofusicoccum parvum]
MVSIVGLIAVAALVYFAVRDFRRYLALRQFKGPPLSGFTRYWVYKASTSGRLHEHFKEWNDKYGSTCRVGPNTLLTKDISVIKRINAVRSEYGRADWYKAIRLHPTEDNITTYMDDNVHTKIRQAMAPGYSGKENQYIEKDIDATLLKMIDLIQTKYLSTPTKYVPLDLARTSTFFTLDTISTVAFGRTFGFLDKDGDPFNYLEQGKTLWPFVMGIATFPELHNIVRIPAVRALWPSASDAQGLGAIMSFANAVVAERFDPVAPVTRRDMLGSFLAHGLTRTQLESETLIQITAGSDSTATAIRIALLHIATNPRILRTLLAELSGAAAAGRLSRPIITDQQARALPYLQACIKEALRIVPPAAGLLPKRVPAGGDVIDGRAVPGGTAVGWNVFGLMRDAAVFGPDAHLFRPERWLLADGAALARMADAQAAVFGAGKHGCLGRSVAMFELDKAVAELVLRFEWEVADPQRPFKGVCMGFFLQEDMFFRVTERKADGGETGLEGLGLEGKRDYGMETVWEDL